MDKRGLTSSVGGYLPTAILVMILDPFIASISYFLIRPVSFSLLSIRLIPRNVPSTHLQTPRIPHQQLSFSLELKNH
jgi:hypothetical protein